MTILQLGLLGGGLIGLAAALLLWRLAPARPDLADTFDRLSPRPVVTQQTTVAAVDNTQRLGQLVMRWLPIHLWPRTPVRELAILRIPVSQYWGQKASFALLGLLVPPIGTAVISIAGIQLPLSVPLLGSVILAAAASLFPDYLVHTQAKQARVDFTRALAAYIDLVALESRTGAKGPRQVLETAADTGDSWVFRRISEELRRSRLNESTPWSALSGLSDELGLPLLREVADVMRLAGDEGAAVYSSLRSRAAAVRNTLMNEDLAAANRDGQGLSAPVAVLALIFMAFLVIPPMVQIVFAGGI